MIGRTAADWVSLLSITHKVTENRVGEGSEIGIRDRDGQLLAVITHPMPGAKWFVHWSEPPHKVSFSTKKHALSSTHHRIMEMEARALT
jgi:hypothetical protein